MDASWFIWSMKWSKITNQEGYSPLSPFDVVTLHSFDPSRRRSSVQEPIRLNKERRFPFKYNISCPGQQQQHTYIARLMAAVLLFYVPPRMSSRSIGHRSAAATRLYISLFTFFIRWMMIIINKKKKKCIASADRSSQPFFFFSSLSKINFGIVFTARILGIEAI